MPVLARGLDRSLECSATQPDTISAVEGVVKHMKLFSEMLGTQRLVIRMAVKEKDLR